jgi:hypothetical protein
LVRDPFLNNRHRKSAWIPSPENSVDDRFRIKPGLVNNGIYPFPSQRVTDIPAVKADHNLSSKAKLSYYWSQTRTSSQYSTPLGGADGLPEPVTAAIGTFITARVQRLNFDYTLTPTKLFHLGAGYQTDYFTDDPGTVDYDIEKNLGLKGATVNRIFRPSKV